MSNKMWDALVEHAKTCALGGKLYIYYPEDSRNVGVVFNNIYELNGLISGEQYFSADSLSDEQKVCFIQIFRNNFFAPVVFLSFFWCCNVNSLLCFLIC